MLGHRLRHRITEVRVVKAGGWGWLWVRAEGAAYPCHCPCHCTKKVAFAYLGNKWGLK